MLSILISSTFNDMQGERDVIRSHVAPALRRVAAQYGESVRLIDLRWGVNTADMSEEDAARKVLDTCLQEIDRCDGYMLCLLGNRYGWVPDYSQTSILRDYGIQMPYPFSVTELEIQYGILQRNAGEKCLVFLRDEVTNLPPELWSQYNDPPEDLRMRRLKKRLEALPEGVCRHYSLGYVAPGEFSGTNDFAQQLIREATGLLEKVFGGLETPDPSQALKKKFQNIIQEHSQTYLPTPALEQELADFAAGNSSVLMLQGPEGSGRTATLCHLTQDPPRGVRVIPYFCSEETTPSHLLDYMIRQLESSADTEQKTQSELEETFCELLSRVTQPVWFAVDGLNMMDGEENSRLSWLPHHLPSNIRFVLTSIPEDSACNQLGESFYVRFYRMPPLPDPRGFLRAGLAAAGKAVPEEILSKVAEHPLSGNYLFCDMVVRMLMLMDRHDFARMNQRGGGIDAINAYILEKIEHLPETMEEMAFLFLYDCGEQITPGRTAPFLSAIAQLPTGLRAQDLQALFPQDWDEGDFSYFTAFLDGFLVCDAKGCYTIPSPMMRKACLAAEENDLLSRITAYFVTLPDNDPVKLGSALPLFLMYRKTEEAANLLLADPSRESLHIQIWNMLLYTRSAVSKLLARDDVLELFLTYGQELCLDTKKLSAMAELLNTRIPPKDLGLRRRMLSFTAQLQLRCKDKRGASQTLSRLLPLEDTPLARARTLVTRTGCFFLDRDEDFAPMVASLEEALATFSRENTLSSQDTLLYYTGLFYRLLFSLQDATGVSIRNAWSYTDFIQGKRENNLSYVDTLSLLGLASLSGIRTNGKLLERLQQLCALAEKIRRHIRSEEALNTQYARLLLDLLTVMSRMDPPEKPLAEYLSPEEQKLQEDFREQRRTLTKKAHSAALSSLEGRYDASMLKILALLQFHLASATREDPRRRSLLEQSTRILWRYFSAEPLSDFARELAEAYISLAECALRLEKLPLYEDSLEKWLQISMSATRDTIRSAKEACHRYPDDLHGNALRQARYGLTAKWTEYAQRLWLRDTYELKSQVDLFLSMYRTNKRRGLSVQLPEQIVQLKTALALLKKLLELEPAFEDTSLTELYQKTLPVAYYSLLVTILEVILLSEKTLQEDSPDPLRTPGFYYPKTATFIESYITRCRKYHLNLDPQTPLRLTFRMAQCKLAAIPYLEDPRQELEEVILMLDTLLENLPQEPIPADWLLDEVSEDSVRRLQCRAYLMLTDT